MIFQWISCLINAAARRYRHSYQDQRENQMVRTELRNEESASESELEQLCGHQHKNRTHAVDTSNRHVDLSAQVRSNLIIFLDIFSLAKQAKGWHWKHLSFPHNIGLPLAGWKRRFIYLCFDTLRLIWFQGHLRFIFEAFWQFGRNIAIIFAPFAATTASFRSAP